MKRARTLFLVTSLVVCISSLFANPANELPLTSHMGSDLDEMDFSKLSPTLPAGSPWQEVVADLIKTGSITIKDKRHLPVLGSLLKLELPEEIYALPVTIEDKTVEDDDLTHLHHARIINLSDCERITGAGLSHIQNATTLNLNNCLKLTDVDLLYITHAECVSLVNCSQLTDEALRHLRNAKILNLTNCSQFTEAGLTFLGQSLLILIVKGCDGIENSAITSLRKRVNYVSH